MKHAVTNMLASRSRDEALLTWVLLVRVAKKARSSVAGPMESAGLSGPALDLLVDIGEHPGTSQQSCADRAAVTKGNVTQHLVRLEQRGLVQREAAGRCNELRLTESGELLLGSVLAAHDEHMREFLRVLSVADQQDLRAILRRLDRGLRQRERSRLDQRRRRLQESSSP